MKQETKCRFGLHDWGKWQPVDYEIRYRGIVPGVSATEKMVKTYQDRECKCCGLRQSRPV